MGDVGALKVAPVGLSTSRPIAQSRNKSTILKKEKYTKTQNREKHLDEKISSSFLNDSFFMTQINAPKTLGQIIQKRKEDF